MNEQIAGLEPQAVEQRPDQDGQIRLSIAVSLKRIADMLDGTTLGLSCSETIFNPATAQNRDVRNHY